VRVLGIDPSTRTGYCVLSGDSGKVEVECCGEIHFPKARGIERVQLIGQEISEILALRLPNLVVVEGYGFANRHTLVTLVEIGTVIRLRLTELGFPWGNCAPNQLKKFAATKGNAKKQDVMLQVFKQWGFEGTDNEVDAFGLAAIGLYAGQSDLSPEVTGARREAAGDWRTDNIRLFG
jgi:crossover junction endodeoxyribonuclease RuvC